MPRADVKRIMRKSNCVFILSRNEGLGISAIEALAYSQLCIAPDIGGLSEVFKENPELLIKNDFNPSDYANKFISCHKDKFRVNRTYIFKNFSMKNIIQKEITLYNEIMK